MTYLVSTHVLPLQPTPRRGGLRLQVRPETQSLVLGLGLDPAQIRSPVQGLLNG